MKTGEGDTDTIRGRIERITFRNEENGYTVAKIADSRSGESVTAVGTLAHADAGTELELSGSWTVHPKFGRQFSIDTYSEILPTDTKGIERYLASGLVKGIGPRTAESIVGLFGEQTLEIIDEHPERLTEVSGIGRRKAKAITEAWNTQKGTRSVVMQLQKYGVSPAYTVRIIKAYGERAGAVLRENPYRLTGDVHGIGFKVADRIAATVGIAADSEDRIAAGIDYVLQRAGVEGHVYLPEDELIRRVGDLLNVELPAVTRVLKQMSETGRVTIEDATPGSPTESPAAVYSTLHHTCETGIARELRRLAASSPTVRDFDVEETIRWAGERLSLSFAPEQAAAVAAAVDGRVTVITGGPGTGKTMILKAVTLIAERLGIETALAAPTGRAAKRMSEATGRDAKTIHRLLEVDAADGRFKRNADNPLGCSLLIIDEASMIDTLLMYSLVKAVPEKCSLLLVGDVDQLPSVGPGSVLKDIIASGSVPVIRLNRIYRQAHGSLITENAYRILKGEIPTSGQDSDADFFFIAQENAETIPRLVTELAATRIPARFGFDPIDDIQVMAPMRRGTAGIENLNRVLAEALNPGDRLLEYSGRSYALGDKVMQLRNDYSRDVFNGDVGRVVSIDADAGSMSVTFDGRRVEYERIDLDGLTTAYAVSIHKSQGAEYPAVIIALAMQHYMLLRRNLLYTAVTRGRRLVVVVGSSKALSMAVKNDEMRQRYSMLDRRLKSEIIEDEI
jgi:exodeoxyribonuclease V alpha subunit